MKKALLLLLLLPLFSNAQWALEYHFTFDSGGTNYANWIIIDTINYHHNQWQIGHPNKTVFNGAYSSPNAIVTDTLQLCFPNDTSVFILKVPKNAWLGLQEFFFDYKLNIDSGDIAFVEISADTGHHWINIDSSGLLYGMPSLTTSTIGWDSVRLYVIYPNWESMFASIDTFLMRFTFITDTSLLPRDGWMIDNIMLGYDGESVPTIPNNHNITLYPNPATASLNIQSTNAIEEITITNLLGQIMTSPRPSPKEREVLSIDVATWPSGVYFVKVNGVVQKFVKE